MKPSKHLGATFGRLTITEVFSTKCRAVCECGAEGVYHTSNITCGRTVSCGCRNREIYAAQVTHGQSDSRTYHSWESMWNRTNPKNKQATNKPKYAEVEVDPAWKDFSKFLADLGERPDGTSLDRIDNSRGYTKDNCRWAKAKEQQENRDCNIWIEHDGLRLTQSEWSRRLGIPVPTINARRLANPDKPDLWLR